LRTAFTQGNTQRLNRGIGRLDPPPQFFIDQPDQRTEFRATRTNLFRVARVLLTCSV
jgi:hypothetical protein